MRAVYAGDVEHVLPAFSARLLRVLRSASLSVAAVRCGDAELVLLVVCLLVPRGLSGLVQQLGVFGLFLLACFEGAGRQREGFL